MDSNSVAHFYFCCHYLYLTQQLCLLLQFAPVKYHWETSLVAQMVKSIYLQCGRPRFNPWVGKISWRRKWQPTPVFLPGKSHGRRNMVGYSPWGHRVGHDWLRDFTFTFFHFLNTTKVSVYHVMPLCSSSSERSILFLYIYEHFSQFPRARR